MDRSTPKLPLPWRSTGGCDFATDPETARPKNPIVWTPDADPATIVLTPSPIAAGKSPLTETSPIGPTPVVTLAVEAPGSPLAAIIPLDDDTLDRLAALTRFWAGLRRPPAPPDDRVTPQRRRRLQQMLRVIDARQAGETYRAIAQTLFPKHRIDPASWAGDALRETIIRLARDGFKLVDGGYRTILRRPRRS